MFRRKDGVFFSTKKWYFLILMSYPKVPTPGCREVEEPVMIQRWGFMRPKRLHDNLFVSDAKVWDVQSCFYKPICGGSQDRCWETMNVKEVHVRNDIPLKANKKQHCTKGSLYKGKEEGKARELPWCRYWVRVWVCKEYDYKIPPLFQEFTYW